jgi:hypothetical protein
VSVTRDRVLFGKVLGSGRSDAVRMEQVGDKFDYVNHDLSMESESQSPLFVNKPVLKYCPSRNIQSLPGWTSHDRILETVRDHEFNQDDLATSPPSTDGPVTSTRGAISTSRTRLNPLSTIQFV